jgi:hypothetical protein
MGFFRSHLDYVFFVHGLPPRPGWEFPAAPAVAWCQSHREVLFLPGRAAPALQEVA